MVLQTAQPGSRSPANDLIERFDLEDDAAEAVRETFEATSGETTITGLSVLVLVVCGAVVHAPPVRVAAVDLAARFTPSG